MSEPENTSTQEKLDAWFASLQLDKPAPLAKEESFFRWCIRKPCRILIAVFGLPIILYGILFVLERYTNLYWICGFTKSEWFSFFGSYLGGVATLIGVVWTILHMKKGQLRQEKIAFFDKEYNAIVNLISKMKSLYCCAKRYHTYENIDQVDKSQRVEHLQKILLNILEDIDSFDYELNHTSMVSSLLLFDSRCECCISKCNLYIIKKEFNKIFDIDKIGCTKINQLLYETLRIKFYVLKTELTIEKLEYSDKQNNSIKKIQKKLEKYQTMKAEFSGKIDEFFSKWEPENFEKMKILLNHYRQEQIKSISHPCPYNEN